MEEKTCSQDCTKCTFVQQVYCSSQRAIMIMQNQQKILDMLVNEHSEIVQLNQKFDSIVNANPVNYFAEQTQGVQV